ncbi:prepilin-type N-terminal cleavage/methylation domain-containing protein [Pseudomonas sp. o96-267]|uniref:PilW family protein n=1 Tax=Pseudomonas sp. o96-267 TaxID=2479853 RepID=UPI000F78730B|nr:PilW family protein [Pseudomonas sp. o96-267]RRV32853.1 prepilin-type N-terminal cleavage/methylation domain-containing protein [Pseudomonas sp. o96-267]
MNHHGDQAGLSLVELMVALAISSFLILGVTQIYIDNKRSYAFQQNQAENQEGGRYTLLLLQQELAKAGYRRRPDIPFDEAFPASNALDCDFGTGRAAKQFGTSQNAICIRYQPHNHLERDCLGNLPVNAAAIEDSPYTDAGEIIVERLYLDGNTLMCQTAHITSTTVTATGELVSGIADLRFEFGVGTASDDRRVSKYIATPDGPVLTIRYTALMRSSNPNLREGIDADTALDNWMNVTGISAEDTTVAALKTADKGNLYQISQSAVMLRNLLP